MTDVVAFVLGAGLIFAAHDAAKRYIAAFAPVPPAPVDSERVAALESRISKAEAKLLANGFRPNG